MKKGVLRWAIAGGVLVASAALVCYLFVKGGKDASRNGGALPRHTAASKTDGLAQMRGIVEAHTRKSGKARKRRAGKFVSGLDRSMFSEMSDDDRKLCEELQEALDADDANRTIQLASGLMASDNPEVRSHAVDALGWFGADALPELTVLMGDANDDVAQNAINAWESGISEIDDAAARLKVSGMALKAISSKDALQSIGAQFSIAATELIDAEEDPQVAFDKRVGVIQSVVDLIAAQSPSLSDVGRDLYEEITGHEWINLSEAERYLNDPDNYELSTDDAPVEAPDVTEIAPSEKVDENTPAIESTVTDSGLTSEEEGANQSQDADLGPATDFNQ